MKNIFLFIPLILFANQTIPMPPMPPSLPVNNNTKIKHKKIEKKPSLPKECSIIPPMLIFMPPPLEADLTKCKNKLFMPKIEYAKKIFSKKHLKVKSVSIVNGFIEVYKISTNKGNYYCNKNLSKCFKVIK